MRRRKFLAALAAPLVAQTGIPNSVLSHEHILVDFGGADVAGPGRYDADEVFRLAKPKLDEIARMGCVRFLECTPNYLGRDPRLLGRLSEATGIDIWTNTGLYAANDHRHLPGYAKTEPAEALAKRWIREARDGVDGVKPRFIKIGVNRAPLHEWDKKVVLAAALTARETGIAIAAHTGGGPAAIEELEIVEKAGAPLERFVWVHAQGEKDHSFHEKAGRAGAWVEFDGIGEQSAAWHEECVRFMAERGLLSRTLISQDSGWYHVGEPSGGNFRGYAYLFTEFVPRIPAEWARILLVENPRAAFGP